MAEDEDGVSDKKSPQNSNDAKTSQDKQPNPNKPDLGIEEAKYDVKENGDSEPSEPISSSSKSTGAMRKEENPFSFRHFLKRDLSLPGSSTYENTGARPKVYANTVQHSPTKIDLHTETKKEKSRSSEIQAKDKQTDSVNHRNSDDTSSSSSVELEIPFSVVYNSESKHNHYAESSDGPFFHRPNIASEPLGMPSLPDFVQDHILVEQAYLNSNGPISVDLDNLPDFTFNTNYNASSSSSLGRRNKNGYSGNRGYDYNPYMGEPSTSAESGPSNRNIPLDLPSGAEAAGPKPINGMIPPHLNLDLTESVNPADRRNVSPRNTFPLDLPPNAGAESMRLPDFLPMHPGRTSPEPEHHDEQLTQIISELERTRSELFTERSRRSHAEEDARESRAAVASLRAELSAARSRLSDARHADRHYAGQLEAATHRVANNLMDTVARASEAESTVSKLKNEIRRLKEELAASQDEIRHLRGSQSDAAAQLRQATNVADISLRELLAGLERLRNLSSTLDPT